MNKLSLKLSLFLLSSAVFFEANAVIDNDLVEGLKPAVISIKMHQTNSAYDTPMVAQGTGFVIDAEKGLIITNRHIASADVVSSYEASFYNGNTADLNFIWNDPTHDFAFLKVDPKHIPQGLPQLKFSQPKMGEEVFIIGNNEGNSHSVQTGALSDLFSIDVVQGYAPQHNIRGSMNTVGGSSGSPIFNDQGHIVGLNYGGGTTTAMAVPVSYIQDALAYISKGETPPRYSSGAIFKLINLDHGIGYYNYSNPSIKSQLEKIPGSKNRVLQVGTRLVGTPAFEKLRVGDIVEKIEGKEIGPDSYILENEINQLQGKPVHLSISRNGKSFEVEVPTFDLNKSECTQFLNFGQSIFAPVNFHASFTSGMPLGGICMTHFPSGSLFSELASGLDDEDTLFLFTEIDGSPINTLEDVIKVIPSVTEKQKFNFVTRHFGEMYGIGFNQGELTSYAKYQPEHYPQPLLISFDNKKMDWVRQPIQVEDSKPSSKDESVAE